MRSYNGISGAIVEDNGARDPEVVGEDFLHRA